MIHERNIAMPRHRIIVLTASMSIIGIIAAWADQPRKPAVPSTFVLSKETQGLIPEVRSAVVNAIVKRFGDPSRPTIPDGLPVEASVVQGRKVYAEHCAKCHGVGGDGRGADGGKLQPMPRDFRSGIFKWKSTRVPTKPLRHDLAETVRLGIPGTAMPSFADLPANDRSSVVEYVRWLAMVGQFDMRVANDLGEFSTEMIADRISNGEKRIDIDREVADAVNESLPELAGEILEFLSEQWTQAELESEIVRPGKATPTSAASIQRGRELYFSNRAKCDTCHGAAGKGDGLATREFWIRPGGDLYPEAGLHDSWGNLNQPWDLTAGQYRGGSGPEDLFRRIYSGIGGTVMPGYGRMGFTDAQIWDLVNYVESIRPNKNDGPTSKPRQPPPVGNKD